MKQIKEYLESGLHIQDASVGSKGTLSGYSQPTAFFSKSALDRFPRPLYAFMKKWAEDVY